MLDPPVHRLDSPLSPQQQLAMATLPRPHLRSLSETPAKQTTMQNPCSPQFRRQPPLLSFCLFTLSNQEYENRRRFPGAK